jgi:hypothetical protein
MQNPNDIHAMGMPEHGGSLFRVLDSLFVFMIANAEQRTPNHEPNLNTN